MNRLNKWAVIFAMMILTLGVITACGNADDQATPSDDAQEGANEGTTGETDTDDASDDTESGEVADESGGDPDLVVKGEAVVNRSCISCHGAKLEGGFAPSLQNLGDKYTKEEIISILITGKGSMPGNLAQGQEEAVAVYLLSLE